MNTDSTHSLKNRLLRWIAPWMAAKGRIGPAPHYTFGQGEAPQRWLRRLRRRVWNHLPGPCVVRWYDGLQVCVHPGNQMSSLIYLTGLFEPNEMHWLQSWLQPGMVALDVGANFGLYSLFLARCLGPTGRVIAFEPSSRDRSRLEHNVVLSRLRNVQVVPCAAGDRVGQVALRIATEPNTGHNTLGQFVYDDTRTDHMETVDLRPLDQIVAELGLTRIDFIKIDTEGAEVHVLRGAADTIQHFRPVVLLEVIDGTLVHQNSHSREIWDYFQSRGYRMHGLNPATCRLEPVAQMPQYDQSVNLIAIPREKPLACG